MRQALVLVLVVMVMLSGCSVGRILGGNLASVVRPIDPAPAHTAQPKRRDARLAVVWLGHATTLIQLDDKIVLADPILAQTAGYMSKRLVEPGLQPWELPALDAVVVSHMHLDHLSWDTLFKLKRKIPVLLLPEGGSTYVPDYGFPQVELPRWQSWEKDGLKITAVPVKHVGWRWIIDRLWEPKSFSGYVLEYKGLKVYFGGDSALDREAFTETQQRFGEFDVAVLAIAPIEPRGFMAHTHMDPGEAVEAYRLLHARRMVPIHHDTFINSSDEPDVALPALQAAWAAQKPEGELIVLPIGGQAVLIPKAGRGQGIPLAPGRRTSKETP